MAASGDHIKALVRSHASGDDESFYAVAMQVAARAARQGHNRLADDLKQTVDASRAKPVARKVTALAQPRGELSELVTASYPEVKLRDIVASEQVFRQIQRIISEQRQRSQLLDRGFTPAHRVLLEGPPGTGKTLTSRVLASELNLPLLTVRLDSILSKYLGETASKLRIVFDAINEQRAVYLFDEFDALGGSRTGNDVGEARRILNSFLVLLEESSSDSLVVAATNGRDILDHALFRRFDAVIRYHLPDLVQASEVLKARLRGMKTEFDVAGLGSLTAGLSHADLVKAAEDAAKTTLLRGADVVSSEDIEDSLNQRRSASLDER